MRRLFAGFLVFVAACQQSPEHRKLDSETLALIQKHEADVPALVEGNNDFALALYQQLATKDGNLFFSPYSISNALAMTYAGARGNTAGEMKATLRFRLGDERLHPSFGNLISELHGDGKPRPFQLSVANRLWGQRNYPFMPAFLKIGRDYYDGGLEEVDYIGDAEAGRKNINAWVERQTKDRIKDLIPPGLLNEYTRLVLTNAVYFKAGWVNPFDPTRTQPSAFHLLGGKTAQTPMMHDNQTINFADHATFSMVEMPYETHEQSMIVLLPKKKDGLCDLERNLTLDNLTMWMKNLSNHRVDLKVPRFKVTAEFNLNAVLAHMGMRDAFDPKKADFNGIVPFESTRERLYISAVLHKAFVDVNEKSTEATAATAVVAFAFWSRVEPPPPATFHVDHPFVFLIRDQRTASILFMGRVTNPAE